MGALLTDSLVI